MRLLTGLLACGALLASAIVSEQARATGFATFHAIVTAPGNTLTGSGVASSAKTAVGTYEVTFARSLEDCGLYATQRGSGAGFQAVNLKTGSPTIVVVTTYTSAAVKADRGFYLLAHCNALNVLIPESSSARRSLTQSKQP
jgi:hypothetical protein